MDQIMIPDSLCQTTLHTSNNLCFRKIQIWFTVLANGMAQTYSTAERQANPKSEPEIQLPTIQQQGV